MKKRLLFVFCTLIAFGLMAGTSMITVNVPNGCTTWNVSTTQAITWTRDPSISGTNVKIRLMKGHGGTEDLILKINDSTANDGSYDWPIPASLTPGSYLIRVKTVDNAEYDDGEFFTLAPAPGAASITVNMPNSSSDWKRGTTKTITWTPVGTMDANVKIRLMKGHGGPEDLILKITESTSTSAGSFSWPIPASVPAGNYLIRVKTIDNAVGDDGDFFDIIIGGGTIPDDRWRWEKFKLAQPWYKIKWPFPWPGPDPDPDPWFVGELPMTEILSKLGKGKVHNVGVFLFLGGKNFGRLGKFMGGKFIPGKGHALRRGDILKFRLGSKSIGMLKRGGAGKLVFKNLKTGKVLMEQALKY